jgi:hypothetical protein
LTGCAGLSPFPEPCGGASYGMGNLESAGTYAGSYTNSSAEGSSGAGKSLDLQLTVTGQGIVAGTATEPSTGRTAVVNGTLGDWFDPCSENSTTFTLKFGFEGETPRTLVATKKRQPFTTFSADARYHQGPEESQSPLIGRGRLTLTKS